MLILEQISEQCFDISEQCSIFAIEIINTFANIQNVFDLASRI
nr:MAG TPA: hypothetical protein [Caudoviricetes sp.]